MDFFSSILDFRLYEVTDIHARRVDLSQHHRDIFLFNDLLVLTKPTRSSSSSGPSSSGGGSGNAAYSYRDSFSLKGLEVTLFHTSVFHYGIQISEKAGARKVLLTLNAGSEHDRYKFVMDLQESIFEVNLMDKVLREIST